MKIKAKFIGKDGSLGYKNGKRYSLWFHIMNETIQIQSSIIDLSLENAGRCDYQSLRLFLDNWEVM